VPHTTEDEVTRSAEARIAELGALMSAQLSGLTGQMNQRLVDSIEPLKGDEVLRELLYASIESNLETMVHLMRYDIPVDEASAPAAAEAYARRLAQRGISSTALIRAYRLGQQFVVDWAFGEFGKMESDPEVTLEAGRRFADLTFRYVDSVSEQVVEAYEAERERWLSHRNTVRAAMIEELTSGAEVNLAVAEQALGYRLRQRHLGVVVWTGERQAASTDVPQLEQALASVARRLGAGQPLFLPRERSLAWGWLGLGRGGELPDLAAMEVELGEAVPGLRVAVGTPSAGAGGFRVTHKEALSAQRVALAAGDKAPRVTSYADAEVRTAALLAADLDSTRRLVHNALGPLAAATDAAERLRDTLRTFLQEKGSYTATADLVQLHKNTVKYRIDRAVEERGRPLDEDRLELELALVACRWLGPTVLYAESLPGRSGSAP